MVKGSTSYTDEQDEFLRDFFEELSASELQERFNREFMESKSKQALYNRARLLGLKRNGYIRPRMANMGVNLERLKKKAMRTKINGYTCIGFYSTYALYEKKLGKESIRTCHLYVDLNKIL